MVSGRASIRWITLGLLSLATAGGCSTPSRARFWEWFHEKDKVGPQVTAPYRRVEKLREMAKNAPTMPEAEQQRLTNILLEDIQKEEDPAMRAEILKTIAALPNPTAMAVLKASLKDPNPLVRVAACEAWRKRGGGEAAPTLIAMMGPQEELDVRMAAARELGELGDPSALQPLGTLLDDPNPAVQHRGVVSLRQVTGKDFGDDVTKWKSFVQGGNPEPPSVVSRVINSFY